MTEKKIEPKKIEDFLPEEKAKIAEAVYAKFGHHLQPGESLVTSIERTPEFVRGSIALEKYDRTEHVEVEASALPEDGDNAKLSITARFELLLDFLDSQFTSYFEGDREARFHDDWRPYAFEGLQVRFRGVVSRPDLEALADAWLRDGGEPKPLPSEEIADSEKN